MLKKLLIANRGEIAVRIMRTAHRLGIATVAVYSQADADAQHVRDATESIAIGPSSATESYLVIEKIIAAARQTGADAIHPGYGFLSENALLPEACAAAGITFVGPRAEAMRALGGKAAAKDLAIKAGVPVVPGYQGAAQDLATLKREAKRIGYPIMIKAVAGGGGRGMRLVEREAQFAELLESAQREAQSAFGNPHVLIEKVVQRPRHIEVQVFGDTHGQVVHLFERDCTLQRRNQKVVEEAPAPGMSDGLRARICDAAVKLAKSVNYEGAGTVEFLVEGGVLSADAPWYFIEMNTRLQVEHPVTEAITGLDLVEWQLRIAAGEPLPLPQSAIAMHGHAIEVRICAEDPANGFAPSTGRIDAFDIASTQDGLRLETGVSAGSVVSPFYDSMIAKLIVARQAGGHAEASRTAAINDLVAALSASIIRGPKTNLRFLRDLVDHGDVRAGSMDTGLIARLLPTFATSSHNPRAAAVAARLLLGQRAQQAGQPLGGVESPWSRDDAFQLGADRSRALQLTVDGQPVTVRARWHHGALETVADGHAGGTGSLRANTNPATMSARLESAGWSSDGAVTVFDEGQSWRVEPVVYDPSAVEDSGDGATIRAPINGKLARVFVLQGAAVEKGQRIAVVEAMKMEHVLTAVTAGEVARIAVPEGTQVTQGTVLVTITPAV